jgi:arylsulfatase A-like enzyme
MRARDPFSLSLCRRELLRLGTRAGLAAGALPLLLSSLACGREEKAEIEPLPLRSVEQPNVVLVTFDTTRADRLGCYGYPLPTSPNLDRLAGESLLYRRACSTSSWTLPSHASLFTGKFTVSHGAEMDPEGPLRLGQLLEKDAWKHYRARGLAQGELTLAALARTAGYATGGVVGGPWMKKAFTLGTGFEFYDDSGITDVGRSAEDVTRSALAWVRENAKRPFLLFLNYYDPHSPYDPPDEFVRSFLPNGKPPVGQRLPAEKQGLYDAEIRYADHHFGRLLEELRASGLYDRSLVVVTADHGELLGEHGSWGHGISLYEGEIHVPLLVKYPRGELSPAVRDERVSLVDVFALVLERLGIPLPGGVQGRVPPKLDHPIVGEVYPLRTHSKKGDWRVIYDGSFKYMWSSLGDHKLFDLSKDPDEVENLALRDTVRADRMHTDLGFYLQTLPRPGEAGPAREIDAETRRALEKLGYLEP